MINSIKFSVVIFCSALLFTACEKDDDDTPKPKDNSNVTATSQFQKDAEGWTIVGDAQGGYVEASYSPDGGVTDGYIYADDNVTGGVWYFASPDTYHGDKSNYYGKTLSYSLFQESAMSNQFLREDIIFSGDSGRIVYTLDFNDFPDSSWTNYSIKISEAGYWLNDHYQSGDTATAAQIKAVLSSVNSFWIRGEFETGPDSGGLDNVVIN